jgi:diadenosine tetraphosphatase ApaH/serine/threonine PP2A family protein phosphatase
LRATLEPLVGDSRGSGLFPGLEPYPDGWRASVRKPEILPHFPTVLHRGGYPDGR